MSCKFYNSICLLTSHFDWHIFQVNLFIMGVYECFTLSGFLKIAESFAVFTCLMLHRIGYIGKQVILVVFVLWWNLNIWAECFCFEVKPSCCCVVVKRMLLVCCWYCSQNYNRLLCSRSNLRRKVLKVTWSWDFHERGRQYRIINHICRLSSSQPGALKKL